MISMDNKVQLVLSKKEVAGILQEIEKVFIKIDTVTQKGKWSPKECMKTHPELMNLYVTLWEIKK